MKKNLLFVSFGDNTKFIDLWINDKQNYDIFGIYYGNDNLIYNKYKSKFTFIDKHIGDKFQNFNYIYKKKKLIEQYDYFFLLDDDIIINYDEINNMFNLSVKYKLKISTPSFLPAGKIGYPTLKHKQDVILSYTNYLDSNSLLFQKDALKNFMEVYDDSLIDYGIDVLCIWSNNIKSESNFAIVHHVQCINPKDDIKKNGRELLKIQYIEYGKEIWENYSKNIDCLNRIIPKIYKNII